MALGLVLASPIGAKDLSVDEQAVWQLEEDYWRYVKTGDVAAYVKLWYDDFVGWPCHMREPARKGDIGKWLQDVRDNGWKVTYQLKPLEAQVFGSDTVVVHYAAG